MVQLACLYEGRLCVLLTRIININGNVEKWQQLAKSVSVFWRATKLS